MQNGCRTDLNTQFTYRLWRTQLNLHQLPRRKDWRINSKPETTIPLYIHRCQKGALCVRVCQQSSSFLPHHLNGKSSSSEKKALQTVRGDMLYLYKDENYVYRFKIILDTRVWSIHPLGVSFRCPSRTSISERNLSNFIKRWRIPLYFNLSGEDFNATNLHSIASGLFQSKSKYSIDKVSGRLSILNHFPKTFRAADEEDFAFHPRWKKYLISFRYRARGVKAIRQPNPKFPILGAGEKFVASMLYLYGDENYVYRFKITLYTLACEVFIPEKPNVNFIF